MTIDVADRRVGRKRPDDEVLGKFARQQHGWFERVRKGSLDPDEVALVVQMVIDRGLLFVSPETKLQLCQERNASRDWGFTKEDFAALGEPPPCPIGYLCVVTLDVGLYTLEQTLAEACHFAAIAQSDYNSIRSDRDCLESSDGIKHQRGLRWRVINLAANWDHVDGVKPDDVYDPRVAPGLAILWEASYSPKWVRAMDGKTVPFVSISGCNLFLDSDRERRFNLGLSYRSEDRQIIFITTTVDEGRPMWSIPAALES